MSVPEPWLRGRVEGVITELQPVAHALEFAREEFRRVLGSVRDDHVWQTPNGIASIGYHVRHCSGSTMRMLTYLRGEMLTEKQFAELADEKNPNLDMGPRELLRIAENALDAALRAVRSTTAAQLDEERLVGRKRLPSSVRGLFNEIAVHTARHVGQIATTARLVG